MVKNLIFIKGMIFACLLQSNLTYAITNTTTNIKTSKSTSKPIILNKFLQFILPAASGSIGKDTLSGFSRMQLVDVDTQVTYFTNHPRRITGSMATGFFLKRWIKPPPRDFTANPPNAMVTYIDDSKQLQQFFIVQLIAPLYQESTRTLSFTIKQLPGSPPLPTKIKQPAIIMSETAVCGVLGAWGDLPGEKQNDAQCHSNEHL